MEFREVPSSRDSYGYPLEGGDVFWIRRCDPDTRGHSECTLGDNCHRVVGNRYWPSDTFHIWSHMSRSSLRDRKTHAQHFYDHTQTFRHPEMFVNYIFEYIYVIVVSNNWVYNKTRSIYMKHREFRYKDTVFDFFFFNLCPPHKCSELGRVGGPESACKQAQWRLAIIWERK